MANRIVPMDPTKTIASLSLLNMFVNLNWLIILFLGPPAEDDRMEFRIFRRSRYHVSISSTESNRM